VLDIGAFATRVLFQKGGLRVFRVGSVDHLRTIATPATADIEIIAQKEAAMAQGVVEHLGKEGPPPPPAKKKASRAKKNVDLQ
jgi:hypothetical protein